MSNKQKIVLALQAARCLGPLIVAVLKHWWR